MAKDETETAYNDAIRAEYKARTLIADKISAVLEAAPTVLHLDNAALTRVERLAKASASIRATTVQSATIDAK